jgi:hypothetical protein
MKPESVTLSWNRVNLNGQVTTRSSAITHTALTCGWTNSRPVCWSHSCDCSLIPHFSHRCDLFITASSTLSIQVQVELEVLDVAYNFPSNPKEVPIIIFSVMINRPCTWLTPSRKQCTYILLSCPSLCC